MDAVNGPNAAVTFTLLVATVTAAFRYLLTVISKQDAQIERQNTVIIEQSNGFAEIAAVVPSLLKENMEWKERYEAALRDRQL